MSDRLAQDVAGPRRWAPGEVPRDAAVQPTAFERIQHLRSRPLVAALAFEGCIAALSLGMASMQWVRSEVFVAVYTIGVMPLVMVLLPWVLARPPEGLARQTRLPMVLLTLFAPFDLVLFRVFPLRFLPLAKLAALLVSWALFRWRTGGPGQSGNAAGWTLERTLRHRHLWVERALLGLAGAGASWAAALQDHIEERLVVMIIYVPALSVAETFLGRRKGPFSDAALVFTALLFAVSGVPAVLEAGPSWAAACYLAAAALSVPLVRLYEAGGSEDR